VFSAIPWSPRAAEAVPGADGTVDGEDDDDEEGDSGPAAVPASAAALESGVLAASKPSTIAPSQKTKPIPPPGEGCGFGSG